MTAPRTRAETSSRTAGPEVKEKRLRGWMREAGKVLVAYSGGVDSAYLSLIATQELGENALCVLGISPSVSEHQRKEATAIARSHGFRLETIETGEMSDPNYVSNPSNRCYFCKSDLYTRLAATAAELNIAVVVDGTNSDDTGDHRPGRAAAYELGIRSPLAEMGLTKAEIRERSRLLGLPTWDKPASPCLSSRIAHGVPVTIERLSQVERGESILRAEGLREFRVRTHGDLARIEVAPTEMEKVLRPDVVERLGAAFRALGFRFVTLDLEGFRSGSMNPQIRSTL